MKVTNYHIRITVPILAIVFTMNAETFACKLLLDDNAKGNVKQGNIAAVIEKSDKRGASDKTPTTDELYDKHIKATGIDVLNKLTQYELSVDLISESDGRKLEGSITLKHKKPNINKRIFKTAMNGMNIIITEVSDGTKGWKITEVNQKRTVEELQDNAKITQLSAYDYFEDLDLNNISKLISVKGSNGNSIDFTSLDSKGRMYDKSIDSKTYLLKYSKEYDKTNKENIVEETFYDDYIMIDGVAIPQKITNRNTEKTSKSEFNNLKFNSKVRYDDSEFTAPSK